MTRYSYNGWPVIETRDAERLTEVVRVGGRAFRFAKGDVARVFEAFLTRFIAEVEPLAGGELDDWSYAVRLTRGSPTSMSCHASGTACDLNSLAHPRGVKGTFGAKEKPTRRLLADFPVLRWGEDFKTAPADSMHFEIDATPAELARFIATLTPPEDDMPTIPELLAAPLDDAATDKAGDPIPLGKTLAETRRWALHAATRTADIVRAQAEQSAQITELAAAVGRLAAAVEALQAPPVDA